MIRALLLTVILAATWAHAATPEERTEGGQTPPGAAALLERPRPSVPRWVDLSPEERASLLGSLRPRTLQERLLEVSRRFLETPYVVSPLGEGFGVDPDPLERYDAVDCLTFVEEAVALSVARGDDEIPALLRELRYAQQVSYEDRNHLMEAQWLPNNVRKGFLRDVTRRYGGEDAADSEKVLTRTSWQSPSSKALQLPRQRQVTGRYRFPIIPIDKVLGRARSIPSGTLLLIVRDDKPGKVTRITHLGFVVQKKKHTYLRHAARNTHGRVVDEDLETFLTRNSKYEKWKVSGVSLFEVRAPPERAVAGAASP